MNRAGLVILTLAMLAVPLSSGCVPRGEASARGISYACLVVPAGHAPAVVSEPFGAADFVGYELVGAGEGPWYPFWDHSYDGRFVTYPAHFGGYLLAVPVGIIMFPFVGIGALADSEAMVLIFTAPTQGACFLGAVILGGPFWLVREVFYDVPCGFVRFLRLAVRDPKEKVDFLVERLGGFNPRVLEDAEARLEKLTGEEPKPVREWDRWWRAHRDEFDDDMQRIKPARPEPQKVPAPVPVPAG